MIKRVTYKFEEIDTLRFKHWMEEKRINQHRIVAETKLTQSVVSNIINGKTVCEHAFVRWCELYHYSLEPREMTLDEAIGLINNEYAKATIQKALGMIKEEY